MRPSSFLYGGLALISLCSASPVVADSTLSSLFVLVQQDDPDWLSAARNHSLNQKTLELEGQLVPLLSLTVKGAASLDQTGVWPTEPSPTTSNLTVPVNPVLSLTVPVFHSDASIQQYLAGWQAKVASAQYDEFASDKYADFLVSLSAILLSQAVVAVHQSTADSFAELRTFAEKRKALGAGNSKDVLRAEVAAQQAEVALRLETNRGRDLFSGWKVGAKTSFEARGGSKGLSKPEVWLETFQAWGLDAAELFDPNSRVAVEGPVPQLPPPVALVSRQIDKLRSAEALRLVGTPGLSVDLYSKADVTLTTSTAPQTVWDYSLQAGVSIEWPILSALNRGQSIASQRQGLANHVLDLDGADELRTSRLVSLAEDFANAVQTLRYRRESRRATVEYASSLESELVAGTSTVEAVLQGLQMLYKAKEDELNAQWFAVTAAVTYLKVAGRIKP